jgi:hypothetical protein
MSDKALNNNSTAETYNSIYKSLGKYQKLFYSSIYAVCNTTLSGHVNSLEKIHHTLQNGSDYSLTKNIKGILKYWKVSLKEFALYVKDFLTLRNVDKNCINIIKKKYDKLTIIDIFLPFYTFKDNDKIKDKRYFPGLYETLHDKNIAYYFLPRFYGAPKGKEFVQAYKNIKKEKDQNLITEYDLLNISDLLRSLLFIIFYPIQISKIALKLKNNTFEKCLRQEIISELPTSNYFIYLRYLTSKRIAELSKQVSMKIFTWTENQTTDRVFIKGLNDVNGNTYTYGCQVFSKFPSIPQHYFTDTDFECGISPNIVLVNGKTYIPKCSKVKHKLGVSLRNKNIFNNEEIILNGNKTLILLPMFRDEINKILSLTIASLKSIDNTILRPHPLRTNEIKKENLPIKWSVKTGDFYAAIKGSKIVIGSGTSSILDSAAMGKSVIVICVPGTTSLNPFPNIGKGVIWDIAGTSEEIQQTYSKLLKVREETPEQVKKAALELREKCYINPTPQNIIKAFDLED